MDEVEVVVAHRERATLRVGEVFLKVDADRARAEAEVAAMRAAPVPTAPVLWHEPPVLALARVRGVPLGRLGRPTTAPPSAWEATGRTIRALHDAPVPPWQGRTLAQATADLDAECAWLLQNDVLPERLVIRNREVAQAALRPWTPVFAHGDLQVAHVFVDEDEVTGVLDWSEAGAGSALYDLASLTLGHPERLDAVLAGYGSDLDREAIEGWWSLRSLTAIRWLVEHGFDPSAPGCEIDVLRSRL